MALQKTITVTCLNRTRIYMPLACNLSRISEAIGTELRWSTVCRDPLHHSDRPAVNLLCLQYRRRWCFWTLCRRGNPRKAVCDALRLSDDRAPHEQTEHFVLPSFVKCVRQDVSCSSRVEVDGAVGPLRKFEAVRLHGERR